MAGVYWSTYVESVAPLITGPLTFIQLVAASNIRVRIKRIGIYGKGITVADTPVAFELIRQTTAGTASALTMNKLSESDDETLQITAQKTFTVEPTLSTIKYTALVPTVGKHEWLWPFGFDFFIKGGERLGIMALTAIQVTPFSVLVEGEE